MLKKIRSSYSAFHKDFQSRCPLQYFFFLLPEILEGNKKKKGFPLPSGLISLLRFKNMNDLSLK